MRVKFTTRKPVSEFKNGTRELEQRGVQNTPLVKSSYQSIQEELVILGYAMEAKAHWSLQLLFNENNLSVSYVKM